MPGNIYETLLSREHPIRNARLVQPLGADMGNLRDRITAESRENAAAKRSQRKQRELDREAWFQKFLSVIEKEGRCFTGVLSEKTGVPFDLTRSTMSYFKKRGRVCSEAVKMYRADGVKTTLERWFVP